MFIYLAGPDIFRPDASEWAARSRDLCRRYGYEPLLPIDSGETDAQKIVLANIKLIRKAQVVIANLDPFRGPEPDSGTCFELGYAAALGKRVCSYVTDGRTLAARVAAAGLIANPGAESLTDTDGWSVEDFGLPVNVMLAMAGPVIVGGLEACLHSLRLRAPLPTEIRSFAVDAIRSASLIDRRATDVSKKELDGV
jgi:nucleoside 2-deoxyribosyltransferase